MSTRTRIPRLALIAAIAAVAAAGTFCCADPAPAADTVVVAVNAKDGSFLYRVRLDVRRVVGSTVDETNAAVALASCDSCETVAVSIQALLVFTTPTVATPTNLAIAMNVDCSACQTLASAYQLYLQTGGPAHFTADGNRQIAQIRRELEAIRHAGLTIWEIQADVDRLANELLAVLQNELVAAGRAGG
jgi:putative peptide zinc metalloprotease protein